MKTIKRPLKELTPEELKQVIGGGGGGFKPGTPSLLTPSQPQPSGSTQ
jgi:bacteriocin-like protein